jgi:hypothetical protein
MVEAPGEKLVIRLWETVAEKGIGSLLRPWQIRREGRAQIDLRREELLMLAEAEKDAHEIRSGRKSLPPAEGMPEPPLATEPPGPGSAAAIDLPTLSRAVSERLVADTLRREVHVVKALLAAEVDLENDRQYPPSRKVDEDWLFRWRDYAGAVSVEELQTLWGRLLAGEIKAPGTFSLRTLEFLRNLSSDEATAVAKLSPFVIADFVLRDDTALKAGGITFGYLLAMQQINVIAGVEATSLQLMLNSTEEGRFFRPLVSHDRVLLVSAADATREIKLPVYQVTAIGRQVFRLGRFEANEPYLRAVGQKLRGQGFDVKLARWQDLTQTEGRYFDPQDL